MVRLGFRVLRLGFRVLSSGFRVGVGFRVYGRLRVWGLW